MTELKRRIQRLKAGAISAHKAADQIQTWTNQIHEDLKWIENHVEISKLEDHEYDSEDLTRTPDSF